MSFLRKVFGADRANEAAAPPATDDRQQLTVLLRLQDSELANERERLQIYGIEDRLMKALDESGAGTHETNELEQGFLRIQLLGSDAERMVDVVRPQLADAPPGSYLAIRRGPPGTSEERLEISDQED